MSSLGTINRTMAECGKKALKLTKQRKNDIILYKEIDIK